MVRSAARTGCASPGKAEVNFRQSFGAHQTLPSTAIFNRCANSGEVWALQGKVYRGPHESTSRRPRIRMARRQEEDAHKRRHAEEEEDDLSPSPKSPRTRRCVDFGSSMPSTREVAPRQWTARPDARAWGS